MEDNKFETKFQAEKSITCPHCGYQYSPDEVLFDSDVLGQTKYNSIIRDPLGKILFREYQDNKRPLASRRYICDNCDKPFIVDIDVSFKAKPEVEELDFSSKTTQLW